MGPPLGGERRNHIVLFLELTEWAGGRGGTLVTRFESSYIPETDIMYVEPHRVPVLKIKCSILGGAEEFIFLNSQKGNCSLKDLLNLPSPPRPILGNFSGLSLEDLCAKKAARQRSRASKVELQGKRGRTSRAENNCSYDSDLTVVSPGSRRTGYALSCLLVCLLGFEIGSQCV